jgi:microcystin-dependent protein
LLRFWPIVFYLERANQLSLLPYKDLVDLCPLIESYQVTKNHVYKNHDFWNYWANWINDQNNVANGDVVAVASYDAIRNAPRGEAAETLLTSINALRAFDAEKGDFRSPYVLLFVKGRAGAMEVCQPHKGPNAHLKTTYYELLNCGNTSVVLRGMIIMWAGDVNQIPVGWALCDGQNGTPDLRDRFIVGAGNNYKQGSTGGVDTVQLTISQMPAHNHENEEYKYLVAKWPLGWNAATSLDNRQDRIDAASGQPIKTVGGNEAHENRPPYYALSYIIKL